jgi:hypothetical protein
MVLNHSCPNHPRHLVVRYERQAENYPGLGMVGLRDDSTQALLKRSLACSVPTATAVARLHAALYSPLLRVSVMASSRGSAWPLAHAAASASSPKCPAGCSHDTAVLGALDRWEGPAPILAQRGGCPTKPRYPFHPLLCDRYSGQPLQTKQDSMLETIRRPPRSRLSSYNLHARPYSPASHATLPRLASVRTMPHAFSVPRDKARPSSSSILARLRSPCPRTAAGTPRRSGVGLTCIVGTVRFPAHILLPGDYRWSESGGLRWLRSGWRGGSAV